MSEPSPPQEGDRTVDWALAERLALALAGDGPCWFEPQTSCAPSPSAPRTSFAATRACAPGAGCPRPSWWAATSGPGTNPPSARCRARSSAPSPGACRSRGALGASVSPSPGRDWRRGRPRRSATRQKCAGQYDVALIGPTRAAAAVRGAEPVLGATAPGGRPRALPQLDRPARDHARSAVRRGALAEAAPRRPRRSCSGAPRSRSAWASCSASSPA